MVHMKIFRRIVMMTLGLCLAGQVCWGERAYVTDSFKIPFRAGPGIEYKIPLLVSSGQPVEVLGTEETWTRVRILGREKDAEGWIESQYIMQREPWEDQANTLLRENTQLKEKFARIEKEWRETGGREQEAARELEEKTRALNELKRKYDALKRGSANYLKLKEEYEATKASFITSQNQVETLTRENNILESSQRHKWFGMGGMVLLCGLLLGLVMGRHQKKRKSTVLYD
jgi:SH3 domain protein